MIPTGNAGGHIAHIGGALLGFAYIMIFRPSAGGYRNQRPSFSWIHEFFGSWKKRGTGDQERPGRPITDYEYNTRRAEHQKRIDSILDKISRGGYDSLTKEEKEILFKSSGK
jgi:hypothetical protein